MNVNVNVVLLSSPYLCQTATKDLSNLWCSPFFHNSNRDTSMWFSCKEQYFLSLCIEFQEWVFVLWEIHRTRELSYLFIFFSPPPPSSAFWGFCQVRPARSSGRLLCGCNVNASGQTFVWKEWMSDMWSAGRCAVASAGWMMGQLCKIALGLLREL